MIAGSATESTSCRRLVFTYEDVGTDIAGDEDSLSLGDTLRTKAYVHRNSVGRNPLALASPASIFIFFYFHNQLSILLFLTTMSASLTSSICGGSSIISLSILASAIVWRIISSCFARSLPASDSVTQFSGSLFVK